ncbi:MAG: hypothetical protein SVU32_00080, partial [Candidatus Nanohaloarchaea archaeon]|nr:hypothetical protein [Candidatus Nanohaloarchaea archaeon]
EILKEGNTVVEKQKMIDRLPFNPATRTFSFQAPTSLQDYRLRVVLGKGDRVFDTFEARYQNLVAERVLTGSGQVREKGACFDNGKCTSQEYQIGTCYDCRNVEQPPQKVSQETGARVRNSSRDAACPWHRSPGLSSSSLSSLHLSCMHGGWVNESQYQATGNRCTHRPNVDSSRIRSSLATTTSSSSQCRGEQQLEGRYRHQGLFRRLRQ